MTLDQEKKWIVILGGGVVVGLELFYVIVFVFLSFFLFKHF